MTKKDLLYIVLAAVIFAVAGILGYSQLSPKQSSSKGVTVEVVEPVSAQFNQNTISILNNSNATRDFAVPPNFDSGLGNQTPIGSF